MALRSLLAALSRDNRLYNDSFLIVVLAVDVVDGDVCASEMFAPAVISTPSTTNAIIPILMVSALAASAQSHPLS